MKKISIITTTYNHQNFIKKSYQNRELLIGDDSPDEETWNIIQTYIEKYPEKIKAWHHIPNKWIVENTNFLLSQVSQNSDYIAFLEGDDLYTADNLKKKITIMNQYPNVAIVYNDLSFIDSGDNIILPSFFKYRKIPYYQNKIVPVEKYILATAGPICSRSSTMIRKSILENYKIHNIDPEKKAYSVSDRDLFFQISTQHAVYWIPQALTQYRRHSNNLSGEGLGTSEDLENLLKYYYTNKIISKSLYNKKLRWTYIVSCIFLFAAGNYAEAKKYYLLSLKKDIFSFLIWKIGITGLFCLPKKLSRLILQKNLKKG